MDPVIIIAEAGVNHNGDMDLAKKLIDSAAEAGADYVKFQTFKTELNISKQAEKASYQVKNTNDSESQYEMVKKLEFSQEQFLELAEYCSEKGIQFLSTAFDKPSVEFVCNLQPIFKVPSGEITNYPYLKMAAKLGKPLVVSTGMANMDEVARAFDVLTSEGLNEGDITILHCNTEYPTPMEDVNLLAMLTMREKFGVQVGYSDHTLGIEVPIAAVALGAKVIEKHFTLDRSMEGPDHNASLEPAELKAMVSAIRNVELAVSGNGLKEPSRSEEKNLVVARKSIHIARPIKKGAIIGEDDLISLRPGDGVSPMMWNKVIGSRAMNDIEPYHKLDWKDISH